MAGHNLVGKLAARQIAKQAAIGTAVVSPQISLQPSHCKPTVIKAETSTSNFFLPYFIVGFGVRLRLQVHRL